MSTPAPTTPYRPHTLRPTHQTPLRQHHSPSSALHLHHAEDPLVFEIGARVLRAGYPNEHHPRCALEWAREEFWKREGDLWGTGGWYTGAGKRIGEVWGPGVEDVGLVEDVIERGVRIAYNKYLLLDSKTRRVVLVVPTAFPVKLLTAVAKTMFVHLQMPSIILLEAPVMVAIAAGTRSALVVDLGWHECVVSVVFELRIVGAGGRSRRGGKVLREMWKAMLEREGASGVSDAEVEEVLARVGWCREHGGDDIDIDDGSTIEIPLSTTSPPTILRLPFAKLSAPADETFFAKTTVDSPSPDYPDDDDLPLQDLIYRVLRRAPIDVRAAAMQRIAIVGGAAQTPNLKRRIIDEVRATVHRRGWDRVGKLPRPPPPPEEYRKKTEQKDLESQGESYQSSRETTASPEEGDQGGENREGADKAGKIAGVESLGSWVGASLVAGMRVRGMLEVERDKFLATVVSGGSGFPLDV